MNYLFWSWNCEVIRLFLQLFCSFSQFLYLTNSILSVGFGFYPL